MHPGVPVGANAHGTQMWLSGQVSCDNSELPVGKLTHWLTQAPSSVPPNAMHVSTGSVAFGKYSSGTHK